MEEHLTEVMFRIFNNWTGLKMAVDHSMGGPDSKKVALEFANFMIQTCLNTAYVDRESVQNDLEVILDEEFETVCEDGSPREIAELVWRFILMLRAGNMEQFQEEFEKLPQVHTPWLTPVQNPQAFRCAVKESASSESSSASEVEEDDGWVQVTRRKR
ncbi:uncharacterized protein LOC109538849 [Dendroctonus ponderosae]